MAEINILTPSQKKLLELFARSNLAKVYYLSGGTALAAFYFQHRLSDDLDFFARTAAPLTVIESFCHSAAKQLNAGAPTFSKLYDRRIFVFPFPKDELKIEFTEYPYQQLATPISVEGISIDSLRDIAANKLLTLLDRFEPKDYVDLALILKQRPLKEIVADVQTKFGHHIEPVFLGSRLMLAENISVMPKMLIPFQKENVIKQFLTEAQKLKNLVL